MAARAAVVWLLCFIAVPACGSVWGFFLSSTVGVLRKLLGSELVFSLASAFCFWFASVAPVRGGTYFSLPPQRKVGKRKRLTPPVLVFA